MFRSVVICVIIFIGASKAQPYPSYDETMCDGLAEDAIVGIPDECDFYYYCSDGVAYLDECVNICEGCVFDDVLNDCNYAVNVPQCSAQETNPPIVTSPPQTQAPVTTQSPQTSTSSSGGTIPDIICPPDDVIFLASENCTEYYVCAMGRKIVMQCLEGLVWNDEDQRCDHPIYSARCSGLDRDSKSNIRCNRHGLYSTAYPFDCEKFVFCAEGIPMIQQCPMGTAWHLDRCIERRFAMCQNTQRKY